MIRMVMRPQKAPVVKGEGLYLAEANGKPLCLVRARNAPHAERKLMFCFRRELPGRTLDFRLEDYVNEEPDETEKGEADAPQGA